MKPQSFKFGAAIRCSWVDSAMRRGWFHPPSEGTLKPQRIVSQGFVVDTNDDAIVLSTSVDDTAAVIGPLIIPWVAITSLNILPEEFHFKEV